VDNRLRAVDTAAKYGLGERSEFSEDVVTANLDAMLTAAREHARGLVTGTPSLPASKASPTRV
jgi:hypothetical protein